MINLLNSLAKALHDDIKVIIGDYPYAAWNNFTVPQIEPAKWYEPPCEYAVILIPKSEPDNFKMFGFLHELGHIMDWSSHAEFESEFYNEVSAWQNAFDMSPPAFYGIPLLKSEFKDYCLECLATYNSENKYDLAEAWQVISTIK